MQNKTIMKLGLGAILSMALIAGYYGCGGSSSSDSGSSVPPEYSNGTLDVTFGVNGLVTTTYSTGLKKCYALARQSDGKIVAAGAYYNGSNNDFALARYTITGTLDTTFDTDGILLDEIGASHDEIQAMLIQPDGKILAGGYVFDGSNECFGLVRYNANGTLDTGFDTDGVVTTAINANTARIMALALQDDGDIIAAGYVLSGSSGIFALARYTSSGALDTTFSTDGIITSTLTTSDNIFYAVAVQADGKIVAAGSNNSIATADDFTLVRYNANGTLDTGFDTDGVVTTTLDADYGDVCKSIAIQPDGKIVVGGYAYDGAIDYFALVRYNANGALDTGFGGGDGVITSTLGTKNCQMTAIALQSDGKIIAAGYTDEDGPVYNGALARYTAAGALDTTFDTDGWLTTDFGTDFDRFYTLIIQPDNKIIAAGQFDAGGFGLARYWK